MTATPSSLVPLPALVADVGGTNARFALVGTNGHLGPSIRVLISDHPTLEHAVADVVRRLPERPRSLILAIAGLVEGDEAPLTNAPWIARPRALIADEGFEEVVILNDFEAVSLSLPALGAADSVSLGGPPPTRHGSRIAIGPGTGLGASTLLRAGDRWLITGGEGGHMDLGPRTAIDEAIWPHLERIGGRISAEWIVSGPGLLRLHRALAASRGVHSPLSTPSQIATAGLSGTDPLALETLRLFGTYLGRYAGDIALIFLPPGGVHIAGGIAPVIIDALRQGGFRAAFEDKAPHEKVMERIPTVVVTHPAPALVGLAALVTRPDDYLIDLAGRRWR
ncbi:MAG: glucokinase [Bauldia sp.]